jgi:hydroxyethylthiazole kinase-like uncharacterized protein yjeF
VDQPIHAYRAGAVQAAVADALRGRAPDYLLRKAAAGLAAVCVELLRQRVGRVYGARVALLVGTGHNGADALLAGVLLRRRGAAVAAVLVGDAGYEPGVAEFRAAGGTLIEIQSKGGLRRALAVLATSCMVVDGIVGESGAGPLRGPSADLVDAIPDDAVVVAVDLPSGIDPDTGQIDGAHIRADVTVTFGAHKPCLLAPPGCYAAGQVEFVDVGISELLISEPVVSRLTQRGVAERLPVPKRTDHKYIRGVLGVVAGSDTYPGAAVLACLGAVRAGVGIARYIGPTRVTDHVLTATPEAVPGIGQVQAWLLGSGVEDDVDQELAIETALSSGLPCVVDAGALEACIRRRRAGDRPADASRVLLTPHAGEAARMFNLLGLNVSRADVEARPLHHARLLSEQADATVLLKGSATLIANPAGTVFSQADGPVWLATAGSGDVLAGIAGALMSAGIDALHAGAMAASLHGWAAGRASAGGPASASVTAEHIPATITELLALR